MNNDNDSTSTYDNATLDNSIDDLQFHQSLEESERYHDSIQETRAQARAFDEVVDGLNAFSENFQEHQEETTADPYHYDINHSPPQHEHVADGVLVGVAAGVLILDKAWSEWGNDHEQFVDNDIDLQYEDENAVFEEALENDLSQWEDHYDSNDTYENNDEHFEGNDQIDDIPVDDDYDSSDY